MKVAAVLAAILFCRPSLPLPVAQGYAKVIAGQSVADPLLVVAIVDGETGGTWDAAVVNKKSGALGLGQVLPQFRPQCAGAPASAACSAEKKRLLDGRYNLGVVVEIVGALQEFCSKKTGSRSEASWLEMYAGTNSPKAGKWCGRLQTAPGKWSPLPTHSVVRGYLNRRRALRLRLEALPPG